jgi:Concanavalin A-like lectin/glucanases superfamily
MRILKGLFGFGLVAALAAVLGAAPALAQTCTPITSGEVARWKGDGNALDSIGTNHGTLQNGTTFGPALFGQGFVVDGVNDYVNVPDSPAISFTSAFTLAAWINPTAPNNGVVQGVVAKSRPGGGTGYRMAVENGKIAIGLNNNNINCVLTSSTSVAASARAR